MGGKSAALFINNPRKLKMSDTNVESLADVVAPTFEEKEFSFRFRKDKETGTQRSSIKVNLAVPNVDGLIAIITNGVNEKGELSKELELVFESITDTIRLAATDLINTDESITSANFPVDKVTWITIANTDRTDRRSVNIPDELWKQFVEEYVEIMPAISQKTEKQVSNAAQVFLKKLSMVRTDKALLGLLKEQFTLFVSATKNGEQYSEIIDLLNRKFKNYLEADDVQAILSNL
jgi:hypothetical protein